MRVSFSPQVKLSLSILLKPSTSLPCVFQAPFQEALLALLQFHFTKLFRVFSVFLQPKPENAVTIAVSSRVLFRTEREQKVFEQNGVEEYLRYQIEHENEPFAPGPAFPFVKVKGALLSLIAESSNTDSLGG